MTHGIIKRSNKNIGGYWKTENGISFVIYGERRDYYSEQEFLEYLKWMYGNTCEAIEK